jgi:chromosome partitioning protein
MGKIICVTNQKGGVGKTTSTLNVGMGLAKLGKRSLLLDLDPQANLTSAIGLKNREFSHAIGDFLLGRATFQQVMVRHNGVDIIPSTLDLSGVEVELSTVPGREFLLKEALDKMSRQFDYVLIDCPPALGLLTLNALTAANEIIVPIQAEYIPLEGVKFLLDTLEVVKKRLNQGIEISGVIVTMFDKRQNLHKEVVGIIREFFGDKLFGTFVRRNVALAESPSFGEDIFRYKPESPGAMDYLDICKEIVEREVV